MISPYNLSIWFSGKDLIIDLISSIVLFTILVFAIKFYSVNREEKHYLYLISSFGLLFLSFVIEILTHFSIYRKTIETHHVGLITITIQTLQSSSAFTFWGVLTYRVLYLLALYLFYCGYAKPHRKIHMLLVAYLLLIAGYLSQSIYYVYHLTTFLLLFIIADTLFRAYGKNRNEKTRMLAYSFLIIMASQGMFIFINLHSVFYILAESIQLTGYLLMLITFFLVLRNEKKR